MVTTTYQLRIILLMNGVPQEVSLDLSGDPLEYIQLVDLPITEAELGEKLEGYRDMAEKVALSANANKYLSFVRVWLTKLGLIN